MKFIKKKNPGVTLIEALLGLSLTGSLIFIISVFLAFTLQARAKSESILEVEQQGSLIVQTISQTVRNAEDITFPMPGFSDNTLTLKSFIAQEDPTVFRITNNIFEIKEGKKNKNEVALTNSNVVAENLTFTNLSKPETPGIVKFQFSLKTTNAEQSVNFYQKTFYGSASLR